MRAFLSFLCASSVALSLSGSVVFQPRQSNSTYGISATPIIERSSGPLFVSFEPNVGQFGNGILFGARMSGYFLGMTKDGLLLSSLESSAPHPGTVRTNRTLHITFRGATTDKVDVVGLDPSSGRSNYFIGRDPRKWHTDVPHYRRVKYADLYPGIDLILYEASGAIEYDFVVSPGADTDNISMSFEGMDTLRINDHGELLATLDTHVVIQGPPHAYIDHQRKKQRIPSRYRRHGSTVSFELADYDTRRRLVIDPVLTMSTYFGGNYFLETANALTTDAQGNIYLTGDTGSTDFPVKNAFQPTPKGIDLFITKLDPTASSVIYSTFLGSGTAGFNETATAIAVDAVGNAFIAGYTGECDFPTTPGAFQTDCQIIRGSDTVVVKLSPEGNSLIYSTYIHGTTGGSETAYDIAIDGAGRAFIAGSTNVHTYPVTSGSFQTTFGDAANDPYPDNDAFVTALDASGSALVYSTFLGGAKRDQANAIALDSQGSAYVCGFTDSQNLPVRNAYQSVHGGGDDAFLAKLSPNGSALDFSTYFGGTENDVCHGIGLTSGYVHIAGATSSLDFPLAMALQPQYAGGSSDIFVSKFENGSTLVYSTYIGGNGDDGSSGGLGGHQPFAMVVDVIGTVYVTGLTKSSNFPTIAAVQDTNAGGYDAFLFKLRPDGAALAFSTFLGGSADDEGRAIAINASSEVIVAGETESPDFPVVAAMYPRPRETGSSFFVDIFIAKFSELPRRRAVRH